jgi:hypothetical protein
MHRKGAEGAESKLFFAFQRPLSLCGELWNREGMKVKTYLGKEYSFQLGADKR